MSSPVCRVCLCNNVKMHHIESLYLQETYERFTGTMLNAKGRRPSMICYICNALLQKCLKFYNMCQKSEKICNELYLSGSVKDLADYNLSWINNLLVTPVTSYSTTKKPFQLPSTEERKLKVSTPVEPSTSDSYKSPYSILSDTEEPCLSVKEYTEEMFAPVKPYLIPNDPDKVGQLSLEKDTKLKVFDIHSKRIINIKVGPHNVKYGELGKVDNNLWNQINKLGIKSKPLLKIENTKMEHKPQSEVENSTDVEDCLDNDVPVVTNRNNAEKRYLCDFCNTRFQYKGTLIEHMKRHSSMKPYKCHFCEQRFSMARMLKSHLISHRTFKCYKCVLCDQSFHEKNSLRIHLATHSGQTGYTCDICGKTMSSSSGLRTHLKIHTGVREYVCEVCSKAFVQKSALAKHMLIHSDERPCICSICGFAFRDMHGLNKHMLIHSGQKPHRCSVCGKSFLEKFTLKVHMCTHTGEKPHVCDLCGRSYIQKCGLKVHMKTRHQKQGAVE